MIAARESVRNLQEYRPPLEGRRGRVRLDFNENTAGFPWAAPGLEVEHVAAYPEYSEARAAVARLVGAPEENLLLTNGSGEGIFIAAFSFVEPGRDRAVTSSPTFALIPHCLRLVGADLLEIPSTASLEFDLPAIESALEEGARMAVFASPDNPTGAVLPASAVGTWLKRFPETLFVMDEAYFGYCQETVMPLALASDNLLVLRTFSKAYGLAGLRIGAVVGHSSLIAELAKVKCPYSVNSAASSAAVEASKRAEEVAVECRATMRRKEELAVGLEMRGFSLRRGRANFLLFNAGPDAAALCEFCRERGVLLRDRSTMAGLLGMVRVTVGTEDQNRVLLECLDAFRERRAVIFDMDGTLVETSKSYDATVFALVDMYSERPCTTEELLALRLEGGFNDDWDATVELLGRRGVAVPRGEIEAKGLDVYLGLARSAEKLLVDPSDLARLARRYRLFVYTGRTRAEYEPVWARELDPLFEAVYCRGDLPGAKPKPAPDGLLALMKRHGLESGFYVGDSVDDMRAASSAGLSAVGISSGGKDLPMKAAGAAIIVEDPTRFLEVFGT